MWGANAVNGVINIITKSSKATKGGLAEVTAGSGIQPESMVRYGHTVGSSGTYLAFAKYSRFADTTMPDGAAAGDGWSRVHGGFRTDWALTRHDSLTVQGDLFSNSGGQTRYHWFYPPFGQPYTEAITSAGGNLVAGWTHTAASGSETSVRGYFDSYRRNDVGFSPSGCSAAEKGWIASPLVIWRIAPESRDASSEASNNWAEPVRYDVKKISRPPGKKELCRK